MGKTFKVLFVLFLAAITVTQTGCSNSKKSSPSIGYRDRSGAYQDRRYVDRRDTTGQSGDWGVITNGSGSFDSILADFMYGISDLGTVSGSGNASTGVRFRGHVDETTGSGKIDLLIWDDKANSGSEPYYWTLQVVRVSNGGGTITVEDNVGEVTFNGRFNAGEFSGTVSFDNSKTDGARGSLGSFSIAECALFSCN